MTVKQGVYVVCNECVATVGEDDSGRLRVFSTEAEAITDAVSHHRWLVRPRGQIWCAACADLDEAQSGPGETLRGEATPPTTEQLADGLYYALLDRYGEALAQQVAEGEARGALLYRVRQWVDSGRPVGDIFAELDEGTARFVPRADNPAAFLTKHIHDLLGNP